MSASLLDWISEEYSNEELIIVNKDNAASYFDFKFKNGTTKKKNLMSVVPTSR